MKTLRFYGTVLMAVLFASLVACSESSDSGEQDKPVKPDTPVSEGDYKTVTPDGGTLKRDDIAINFPSGTFSSETKVAVSEANANNIVGEDARSKFYQVTLPEMGATKQFSIKLKCNGPTDNVRPVVKTIAYNKHTGETTPVVFDIESTESNGVFEATIPALTSDGNEKPYFTIGLAQCPPDNDGALTRANDFIYQYRVGVPYSEFENNREKYNAIRTLIIGSLPEVFSLLKSLGFNYNSKTVFIYRLVSPKDNEDVKGCWGVFKPAWYGKEWSMISLNKDYFFDYIEKPTTKKLNDLKATLIHETLHAVTTLDYDPRSGWGICKAGEKGDDWAQFDEGLGCWVEKVIGAKVLSENTVKWQRDFIYEFYPHERNQDACKGCGYGMATFIEHLARKTSDQSIVKIYEDFKKDKEGKTKFKDVLNTFLSDKNIKFFDAENYYNFAFSVMNNELDSQIKLDDCITLLQNGKTTETMKGKDFSYKNNVYNYGVLVHELVIAVKTLKQYKDSSICVTQNNEGLLTRVYYRKGNKLMEIGQCEKGSVSIMVKDLCDKCGLDLNESTGKLSICMATTRLVNKDDYSSLPSDIKVGFGNVKEELKMTDVTELEFNISVKAKDSYNGNESSVSNSVSLSSFDDYEITQKGTTVHLVFTRSKDEAYNSNGGQYIVERELAFDIVDFSKEALNLDKYGPGQNGLATSKIENLTYFSYTKAVYPNDSHSEYKITELQCGIPTMYHIPSEASSLGRYHFICEGGAWKSEYWTLNAFSYKETYKDPGKSAKEHNYTLTDNRDDLIYLKLKYDYITEKK